MPGSVYVIISTADLPINTMLSRFVLKKQFAPLQVRICDSVWRTTSALQFPFDEHRHSSLTPAPTIRPAVPRGSVRHGWDRGLLTQKQSGDERNKTHCDGE